MPSNGEFDLENAAQVVHVGLPYVSDIETLDISSLRADVRDKKKNINGVSLIVDQSAGFETGPDFDNLEPYKTRTEENYGSPDNLLSELIDISITSSWDKKGRVCVRQSKPLPCSILTIIPQVEVGGH